MSGAPDGIHLHGPLPNWKFSTLLFTMAGVFVLHPALGRTAADVLASDALETAFLTASVFLISNSVRHFAVAALLGLPSLICTWLDYTSAQGTVELIRNLSMIALLSYQFRLLIIMLLREVDVDWNHVLTAVTGYFVLGFIGASVYEAVNILRPSSFSSVSNGLSGEQDLLYFSFSTLTTLGYGDVVPTSSVARVCAVLEGIVGQFYLALFVARIVGLQTARSLERRMAHSAHEGRRGT